MHKRIFSGIIGFFVFSLTSFLILFLYVRIVSHVQEPSVEKSLLAGGKVYRRGTLHQLENNWFRKSECGLYEMYVEGAPLDRGVAIGKLTDSLIQYQEDVFQEQIRTIIPSPIKLQALKYLVGWFNRNLDAFVPEEFKLEIYGSSLWSSHKYDDVAPAYQRALNYHAAHDIGHALQNMSLVGCTAFATWGSRSKDSTLLIGRNFDFYVGDEFARNKIVAFYKPEKGYPFMMVTFPGMTGALSGMNNQGLTITLNAAKSEIPSSSATPVSILAREILQYATTIEEAYRIAKTKDTFVSETFLIGSALDGRAAVIEKTSKQIGLYSPHDDYLICTNHFQSPELRQSELNKEHMRTSSSVYRFERVKELLDRYQKNSPFSTATILRDRKGKQDQDIGWGNEKSIDQLIAHHSIIFQPQKKRVWVSSPPWVLGKFVCYDLTKIFEGEDFSTGDHEIIEPGMTIAADAFLGTKQYRSFVKYSEFRYPFSDKSKLNPDSLIKWNPENYFSYLLAGDFYKQKKKYERAINNYAIGITKEIATEQEKVYLNRNLQSCKNQVR